MHANDKLTIQRTEHGGFALFTDPRNPAERGTLVAAFTDVVDLLDALPAYLMTEAEHEDWVERMNIFAADDDDDWFEADDDTDFNMLNELFKSNVVPVTGQTEREVFDSMLNSVKGNWSKPNGNGRKTH